MQVSAMQTGIGVGVRGLERRCAGVFSETFLPFAMLAAVGSTAKTALKVDIAHRS
jgi:hypothetical protein